MASDHDFNRKSFTTGHTGFGVPYATNPDHSDVPRSAARPLRYMDRYVSITQGMVFYISECLATLEGIERGPAGNTGLTAVFALAQEMPQDAMIVSQETEYTGAGKHFNAQLSFAREQGLEIKIGDPKDEVPGKNLILPSHPGLIKATDLDLDHMRKSIVKRDLAHVHSDGINISAADIKFLCGETRWSEEQVKKCLASL
jgi:hypothetical protein